MRYLEFLQRLHGRVAPPTYLEIGVRHGDSLVLAAGAAIGIDPAPRLHHELPPTAELFEEASDQHFARERPLEPFGGRPVAMAFIDGMHLVEFALRDFMHVERHAAWTSVAVFDDQFPREVVEAARRRRTRAWTGDVFKVWDILGAHRPDLIRLRVDTEPTGLLVVLGLDPASRLLADRYLDIVRGAVRPDPQDVPAATLARRGAIDPERLLAAGFWDVLRAARERRTPRDPGLTELRRAVTSDLGRRAVHAGLPLGPLRRLTGAGA